MAPAGTPRDIVTRLNSEVVRLLRTSDLKSNLEGQGLFIIGAAPEEFTKHLRAETDKWAKVVKAAGARVD
jgi:tripartite-type tricarboxylate transporter receptor subunit TctC